MSQCLRVEKNVLPDVMVQPLWDYGIPGIMVPIG